jgi:D-amino-acid dehydrogenase
MKIFVIGAGLLGSSSAYFLSKLGHEVVVLERQPGPGIETSFANAGMLTPSQAAPWNQPGLLRNLLRWIGREDSPILVRSGAVFSLLGWGSRFMLNSSLARFRQNLQKNADLARYSLGILQAFRERYAVQYDATTRGTLKFFVNRRDFDHEAGFNDLYREAGIDFRLLDSKTVLQVEPALADISARIVAAIHYPNDESGDAHLFCKALAEQAANAGAEFRYGIKIRGFERSGNKISAVVTDQGTYPADAYVLAAGSYSPLLAASVGLRLPIRPVKGYSLTFNLDGWDKGPCMPLVDESAHTAITPLGSRLRVAGTAEFNGYNTELCPGRLENMARILRTTCPGFIPHMDLESAIPWAGLRPYSCDGVPLLGPTPLDNLYLNTGHGHLGWSMSMGSGKLVADFINGTGTDISLSPFQLTRFR